MSKPVRNFRVNSRMGAGVEGSIAIDQRDLLVEIADNQKVLIEQNARIIEQNDGLLYWVSFGAKASHELAQRLTPSN